MTRTHSTSSRRHSGRRRPLTRAILTVAGTVAATAAALAPNVASAPAASAAPVYGDWKIGSHLGGIVNQSIGGWFDGLVFVDRSPTAGTPYKWKRSGESYIGPGGRKYYNYRHIDNSRCLSHDGDLMIAEPCVWSDNGQWWAAQEVFLGYQPVPPGHLPIGKYAHLMNAWDAPTKVATNQDDVLILQPKVGTTGSAAQHLTVQQLIIPH